MLPYINEKNWNSLEEDFRKVSLLLAGAKTVESISEIGTIEYESELKKTMASAYKKAENTSAKAIYFEYDLDNYWSSNFFICPEYNNREVGDEDWACDWIEEVEGPDFDPFADIYKSSHGFDVTDRDKGITLYLVARTVAVFGRCSEDFSDKPFVLCMGFHDQSPIMRIKELGS